jgi:hypothetical protein
MPVSIIAGVVGAGVKAATDVHSANKMAKVQKQLGEMDLAQQKDLAEKLQKTQDQQVRLQILMQAADEQEKRKQRDKNLPLYIGVGLISVTLIVALIFLGRPKKAS